MKTKFKFFKGYIGTLDIMDGVTYATASLNRPENPLWTNEQVMRARLLNQHETDRIERERVRIQAEIQSRLRQYGEHLDRTQENIERNFSFGRIEVVRKKETLWDKIKLVFKETWNADPYGTVYVTLLMCLLTFIGIMKLFGA